MASNQITCASHPLQFFLHQSLLFIYLNLKEPLKEAADIIIHLSCLRFFKMLKPHVKFNKNCKKTKNLDKQKMNNSKEKQKSP